jgi:hypothetical protein
MIDLPYMMLLATIKKVVCETILGTLNDNTNNNNSNNTIITIIDQLRQAIP